MTSRAADLKLSVGGRVTDGEPSGVEVDSSIGHFTVENGHEVLVPPGPAQLSAHLTHLAIDHEVPLFSLAELKLQAAIAQITLAATLNKLHDAVAFDVAVDAQRAALLTAFAPPALGLPPRMAFTLKSRGRLDDLLAPRIKQSGSAARRARGGDGQGADAGGRHARRGAGVGRQSEAAEVGADAPAAQARARRRGARRRHAHPRGQVGTRRPSFELTVDGTGPALPDGHLAASFAWEAKERAVRYAIDGQLGNLEALSPLLPASLTDAHWIDLSDLKAKLSSKGLVSGVVTGFDRHGAPTFSPNPLATLRGDDQLRLELQSFHYVDAAGVELSLPSLVLTTQVRSDGTRHHGEAQLDIPDAALAARKNKLSVHALVDKVAIDLEGDPRNGPIDVTHQLSVGRMRQDAITFYPIGFITQETHARRTRDGTLQLDRWRASTTARRART